MGPFGLCARTVNKNVIVTGEKVEIQNDGGKTKKGRKLTFESELNGTAKQIWNAYRNPDFMNEISGPKGSLRPKKGYGIAQRWIEKKTDSFNLTVQRLVPVGSHFIPWEKMDEKGFLIQTVEKAGFVRVWNNKMAFEPMPRSTCVYRDELVVHAGILMGFAVIWAIDFYRYWHKKPEECRTTNSFRD